MLINLTKVGTLVVRNGEAITGMRRKIDGASRLAGFSVVDANRLAVTVSEVGRRLLSAETDAVIGVYLNGTKAIDGLALSFPKNEVVADILRRSNYFDHLAQTEEDGSKWILALKYRRGITTALDEGKLRQFEELLSRLSREELMGELQTKNEELEAHRANLERTVAERTASLSEKEAQLRLAMENMTDGIYVLDETQNFVLFNEQYVKQVNLPKGTIKVGGAVKKAVRAHALRGDYGSGEVNDLVKERLQALASPERRQAELSIDGGQRILDLRKASVDGRGAVVIATDITERKEAEEKLAAAHSVITSSIQYASRIQRSILPPEDMISSMCADHFVIWEPRDVVGGDIFWCKKWGKGTLLILGDCTGHGVPGAFMTLIATGALERAQMDVAVGDVAALIQRMHQFVQETLGQHGEKGESDDGMELGVCFLTENLEEMYFSGARFELFVAGDGEIETVSGTKKGIGYRGIPIDQVYDRHVLKPEPGLSFYMTSDGLIDQVGGDKRRGFGKRRFRELVDSIQSYPFSDQRTKILETLKDYQRDETRRDDIALIGFKF